MPLTPEQKQAIVESVYERAARGEPPLTPRLAAESRRRKAIRAENALDPNREPGEFERLVMRKLPEGSD